METQSYKVEDLQLEDVNWFVNIAAKQMLEDELKRPNLVNLNQLYALTAKSMEQRTAFVAKKNGKPIGAIAGLIAPNLYNPDFSECIELFWYVLPEYRIGRAGLLLMDTLIARGRSADATVFSLLPTSNIKHKTLEKRGLQFRESGFIKFKEK